jgi:hypothetical protein
MKTTQMMALFSRLVASLFKRLGGLLSRQKGIRMSDIELAVKNAGFEEGWREVDGIGELKVAEHWFPWWHETDTRPEYKIATLDVDANRVHSGSAAQQWFNNYATHTGGIYQQIQDVPVGKALTLTAFVQAFSRNDDGNWRESDGRYRMRIGLDPYGGTDPESKDVVWSQVVQPYDKWFPLRVETTSRSDRCTIFVWAQAEWRVKHNNGYVDDCRLVYAGEDAPPDPPPSGDTKTIAEAIAAFARAVAQAANELAARMDELDK